MMSFWCFINNFEHISHHFSSVFMVDFGQVNVSWVERIKKLVPKKNKKVLFRE